MSSDIQVIALSRSGRDIHRFLKVSHGLYRDHPHWVAPLYLDAKKVFTPANPFFDHADMQLWVARRAGQDVGRIAGIQDHDYVRCQQDRAAYFGFFESVDDPAVSQRLFETVFAWARERQLNRVLGPMNPSANDECGLLVEGFDAPPLFMMPYNPRYYVDLIGQADFTKAKDLLAFFIKVTDTPYERLERISAIFHKRQKDLRVRPVLRKTLAADLAKLKEVYNDAWQNNWGFVPMTDAEINFMAERLKPIVMEGLVWLAEAASEPAGFMLTLPDFNEVFQPLRGRLCTPRLWRALPYLLGRKRPRMIRLIALGVKPKFQGKGLESVMFAESFKVVVKAGFEACEASWILEDNTDVQKLVELFGGKVYKRYRLYERAL